MAHRTSPFDNPAGRQSPFRRQNSASPATVRGATPTSPPSKTTSMLSPSTASTLSPEKTSPFVRRPSQMNHSSDRPMSPFARPSSSLSIPPSPSRNISGTSQDEPLHSPSSSSPAHLLSRRQAGQKSGLEELDNYNVVRNRPHPAMDGAESLAGLELPEESSHFIPSIPLNLRPVAQRTTTSSTTGTARPAGSPSTSKLVLQKTINSGGGAYNHASQPLLHSMREAFEVLDSSNCGTVNSAAVSDMLSQIGLDNTPAALRDFFPPTAPAQLNLAKYLDVLSGPLTDLSQPDELRAAFEAFDVDDSGQIDVSVLRDALLYTVPQPGEDTIRLSEREIDGILGEFSGRRAFGSKGLHASKGKGEVFKYRDFMADVSGGGLDSNGVDAVAAA